MSKKIWRPLNTYGLVFIGVCVSVGLIYAVTAI